jgi:transcriptional regulator with XRE-family HTH domain
MSRSVHVHYLEFAARLRAARRASGMTQLALAQRLGRPQSYVSKVEICERRMDLIETAEWCIALGTGLRNVLPRDLSRAAEIPSKAGRRKTG